MTKLNHALKMLIIILVVFSMGYILESLRRISSIAGDYFTISTELLALVLSFSISGITWYSYSRSRNDHSLFLGTAFFVIGLFDMFHLLSYPFMPDFITSNTPQKAIVFWSEARILMALLFLASAYIYKDTLSGIIKKPAMFASAMIISIVVLAVTLFFLDRLPGLYSPQGMLSLTSMFLLLITAVIILYSGYLYILRLRESGQRNLICLIYGLIIVVFSFSAYFFFEYPEHLLRAAGFYFIYLALYKSSIDQPYEQLVKTGEKIRQATEEKYHYLFDNAHDAIITSDLNDTILSWNRSAEKMYGWTAEEAIGKKLSELIIPPGSRDERQQILRNAASGMAVMGIDAVNLRKDGTEINVSVTLSPLQDSNKNTIALSSIVRDVTERKRAEEALQQSEEKYRMLIDNMQDGVFIIQDGKIQFVNEAFAKTAGYTVEETLGRDFLDFIAPEDKERVIDNYSRRLAGEDVPKEYEFSVMNKEGARIIVNVNVGLITYRGRAASMGTIKDITERKQAEEALSWQVEINAAMVELSSTLLSPATVEDISALVLDHAKALTNSPYGYVGYIDPKTGYLVCPTMSRDMMDICKVTDKNNILKEFRGLFGWVINNRKSILTNDPANDPRSTGTPPGHIAIHRFLSAPAMLKRKLVGELSVPSSVGNKIHVMRYYDKGSLVGQIALANSSRDYTERDLALVERLADIYAIAINRYWAEEQIKESLTEKEVLIKEIHHRVKNNMQIISSLLRLQSRDITEKKYIDMFTDSQNRITSMALIHEKLYQSKGLTKIDFDDYIRDLANGLFQSYGANGNIRLNIDVRDVSLGIDSAIPCGLIVNELVTNSLKHAFPQGRKGEVRISLHQIPENMIELIVSDNGVSIPENVDIRKTESLGLHLVTILVENQLHGEINLDRSKGTEFLVKFKDVK